MRHFKAFVKPALWQVLGKPGLYFNTERFGFRGVSQHVSILPATGTESPCRERSKPFHSEGKEGLWRMA